MIDAGFPDHHSPPLGLMWSLYSIIDFWLALDKENVIAVHCLAGKGRTGMTIVCTLLMQGFFNNLKAKSCSAVINAAINYFHDKRGDGVENPDQIRFIYQFLQSMNTMGSDMLMQIGDELQPAVHVSSLILYNLPVGEGGFLLPRLKVYLKKENSWNLVFCSVWNETRARHVTKLQPSFVIPVGRSSPVLGRLDRTCAGTFSLCSLTTSSPCSTFPSAPCCCRGD